MFWVAITQLKESHEIAKARLAWQKFANYWHCCLAMKNKRFHLPTQANTPNFLGIWKMFCSMTGNQPASQAALNQSGGKTIWETQKWKNDVRRLTTQWRHHRRVDVVVIANLEVRFYSEPIFEAQKIEMRSNYLVFFNEGRGMTLSNTKATKV